MKTEQEVIDLLLSTYPIRYCEDKRTLVWDGLCFNGKNRIGTPLGSLSDGYYITKLLGRRLKIHRVIFYLFNGFLPEYVDHIDRNTLNNSPSNLRGATKSQNQRNQCLRKDNKIGHKGVYQKAKRFYVRVSILSVYKHIDSFQTLQEAVSCYDRVYKFLVEDDTVFVLTDMEFSKIKSALLSNRTPSNTEEVSELMKKLSKVELINTKE